MEMLAGTPRTQMSSLGSSFKSDERNAMIEEVMEEYALAYVEAACEDPGEQAPMEFMAGGGGFHEGNVSHWWDQKQS